MKLLRYWSPKEVAEEALAALRREPRPTPEETWARLIKLGFINSRGEVTKLLGGDADPEPGAINVLNEQSTNERPA